MSDGCHKIFCNAKLKAEEQRKRTHFEGLTLEEALLQAHCYIPDSVFHFKHKTVGLKANTSRAAWREKAKWARVMDEKKECKKKMKAYPPYLCIKCKICRRQMPQGCHKCNVYLHTVHDC